MEIKTFKVFSYCDDFTEEDDMQGALSDYGVNDSYITYVATKEECDPIGNHLVYLGANHGEEVLIHLDW